MKLASRRARPDAAGAPLLQGRYAEAAISALSIVGAGAVGLATRVVAKIARPIVATATNGLTRVMIKARTRDIKSFGAVAEFIFSLGYQTAVSLKPTPIKLYQRPTNRVMYY